MYFQVLVAGLLFWSQNLYAAFPPGSPCTTFQKANLVTHYFIPLFEAYDDYHCDKLEGTCIYKKNGEPWLHNYGYPDQRLADARCKNGYGNNQNCLNPCRVLAASMKHHTYGEIIYMPELVGKRCGNLARDGFEIPVHDGYMIVMDTGSPKHFNKQGRFDFFWGRCENNRGGLCFEGAVDISNKLSNSNYCIAWNPKDPKKNTKIKDEFIKKVRIEATLRRDYEAGKDFDRLPK